LYLFRYKLIGIENLDLLVVSGTCPGVINHFIGDRATIELKGQQVPKQKTI